MNNNNSIGVPTLLFLIFLVLKLTGVITWSWWWVTAPLWAGFIIGLLIYMLIIYLNNKRF